MAIDLFLKIEGITGESRDARHKAEIELLSFSWGQQESGHATGGGGAGKVSFQDIQFTARVNKASPHLFLACASGRHFPKATMTARRAGGELEFLKLTFQDVLVSSFHDGGAAAATDAPVDQVSLNFGKVTFEYVPQRPDGRPPTRRWSPIGTSSRTAARDAAKRANCWRKALSQAPIRAISRHLALSRQVPRSAGIKARLQELVMEGALPPDRDALLGYVRDHREL